MENESFQDRPGLLSHVACIQRLAWQACSLTELQCSICSCVMLSVTTSSSILHGERRCFQWLMWSALCHMEYSCCATQSAQLCASQRAAHLLCQPAGG